MNTTLAIARGIHFASALLLFGAIAFALFVAGPAWRGEGTGDAYARDNVDRFVRVALTWGLILGFASWLLWLACEAVEMSGASLAQAMSADVLARVVGRTGFGRLWLTRLAIGAALAAVIWASRHGETRPDRGRLVPFALAAALLGSLAWAGHAAAGKGAGGVMQLVSDIVHLLAAGAWLGALPGLIVLLGSRPTPALATAAARRFSSLGLASVGALLVTGIANSWFLVGTLPRLFGTDYGRLLLCKLALFVAMLALAAVNRFVLTPRLALPGRADLDRLRRNASLETAAGLGVVAIVAVLGITVPGAHQQPVWPFSRGLDLERAYPSSYMASPVRYSTQSIAHGAVLYEQQCAVCHGASGHGDGPAATSLAVKPTNLAEHASRHRPGDLFWLMAHGIAGTPMPAFAPRLGETDLWSLVQFLRTLSDADAAEAMTATVPPPRPITAPDFTYELGTAGQRSLSDQRGRSAVLLVLYTLPDSLPRLRELQSQLESYARHGARVIALPMLNAESATAGGGLVDIAAVAGADVSRVYAMFALSPEMSVPLRHTELLIDRGGYLRRRWTGVPDDPQAMTAAVLDQIDTVAREPLPPAPPETHAH